MACHACASHPPPLIAFAAAYLCFVQGGCDDEHIRMDFFAREKFDELHGSDECVTCFAVMCCLLEIEFEPAVWCCCHVMCCDAFAGSRARCACPAF
jgi:hypothetical protein